MSSFSFGQGEKEIEEEEEAVAKTEATAALFQRMELNEPIKRTQRCDDCFCAKGIK